MPTYIIPTAQFGDIAIVDDTLTTARTRARRMFGLAAALATFPEPTADAVRAQARADNRRTLLVRIADERDAVARTTPGTHDHTFAVLELDRYIRLLEQHDATDRARRQQLTASKGTE